MAEGLNKAILIGNIGQDPELRYTQGGQPVLNLRLATTETFVNRDKERQQRTEWHTVVVWGKRGEALHKILAKGRGICVEGRIQTRKWEDKEGNKRYGTEIVATNVILLGGRGQAAVSEGTGGYEHEHGSPAHGGEESHVEGPPDLNGSYQDKDDDIPF